MLAQGIETSVPTFAWYLGDKHVEPPFMVNRQNLCSFYSWRTESQPYLRIKKGLEARVPWVDCVHHSLFYYKTKLRPEALSHYTASSSGWLLLNRTGCPLSKKRNVHLDMDNTKLPNNPQDWVLAVKPRVEQPPGNWERRLGTPWRKRVLWWIYRSELGRSVHSRL